jgi:hypothetical protein
VTKGSRVGRRSRSARPLGGGLTSAARHRRRIKVCWAVLVAVALLVGPYEVGRVPSAAASGSYPTTESAVSGGGYENVVALEPGTTTTSSVLAVGGDTSGVAISTNSGTSWTPANRGLITTVGKKPQELHVAALQWVPGSGSTYNLYAAVGNGAAPKSEVIELPGGDPANSWTEVAGQGLSASLFTVDGTNGAGGGTWADSARPTGQLMVTTPVATSNNIYVAAQEGIVEDRAGTWSTADVTYSTDTAVAPTGMTIYPTTTTSGIASTNNGFVTLENQLGTTTKLGVWFVNDLGSGTTSAVCQVKVPTGVAANDPAQEVVGLQEPDTSGVLYVAYGQDGLWRYVLPSSPPTLDSVCTTGTWSQVLNVSGNSPTGAGDCSMNASGEGGLGSVAGYTTSTGAIVWAGCNAPTASSVSNELWRITVNDSTSTMTEEGIGGGGSSSGSANISSNINGGSLTWWHIDPTPPAPDPPNTSTPNDALGASLFVPAQLVVEPAGPGYGTQVWASGRSGVWRSTNAGATMSSVNFAPVVSGLSSTVDFQVVGAPDTSYTSQVADADHDWQVLLSSNSMKSGEPLDQEPNQTVMPHPAATSVSLYDTGTTDAAVVGFANGSAYYNLDPYDNTSSNTWKSLGTLSGSAAVYGLVIEKNASSDIVILAATGYQNATNQGIGYMVCGTTLTSCGTTWHYPTTSASFGSGNQNNSFTFFWSPTASSQYVYVYDQHTGLWASNNYGESGWVNVGNGSKVTFTGVEAAQVGYLTGYVSGSTTTLWVSNGIDVYKYSPTPTCYTAGSCPGTAIATTYFSNPGPLTADNSGNLYVTEEAASSYGPILWELSSGATTPVQVSDSEYPAYMVEPDSLDAAPNGSELYLSSPGQGIGVVTP